MLSRPQISEYAGSYGLPLVFLVIWLFFSTAGAELLAQNNGAPNGSDGARDLKIEVLDVTTGSGSKAQEKPPLKIEVMDAGAASGSKAADSGGQTRPAAPSAVNEPGKASAQTSEANADPAEAEHAALFAALDRWHFDTLASYNFDIASLADPFMPIQEVRGQPEVKLDPELEAALPPLLRLTLNQLKLTAITSLANRTDGAWASFEDGAGNTYILRQGERIGRNHGRITRIASGEVWVEERGPLGTSAPETTVIKLNILDTQGLTRADGGATSGALQTLSVPAE